MLYTIPDYYIRFSCLADKCEDTCCAGWQIVSDERSLRRYWNEKGDYREKLRSSIRWNKKQFKQDENHRCAFLKDNNLCEMYEKLGAGSLCRTCSLYPRHIEEFENVKEISLSLSCPEAARIILNNKKCVTFIDVERKGEEEYEDFDYLLYSLLLEARKTMLELMQKREMPVIERRLLCVGLAHDLQKKMNDKMIFDCDEHITEYKAGRYFEAASKMSERMTSSKEYDYNSINAALRLLNRFEVLQINWKSLCIELQHILFDNDLDGYNELRRNYAKWQKVQSGIDFEILCEQIFVYYIFIYFCGAVYDGEISAPVYMANTAYAIIDNMLMAIWVRNNYQLDMDDVVELVYRFSRELEHSDKNLEIFKKGHFISV